MRDLRTPALRLAGGLAYKDSPFGLGVFYLVASDDFFLFEDLKRKILFGVFFLDEQHLAV